MNLWQTLEAEGLLRKRRRTVKKPLERFDEVLREELRMYYRNRIELIWELVSKPVKFPARRRRSDRQVPKAA